MGKLLQVRKALTDKLIEWEKDEHQVEIIIDSFLELTNAAEWSGEQKLIVLEQTRDYFVDGFIRDRLIYEINAIKAVTNVTMEN